MFTDFETIQVGEVRSLRRLITPEDVARFVEITGDDNPLHVDRAYAETTPFKDIVVHGMLGASFISTVIGTQLPGPGALWVSQSMEFHRPVRLGDELIVSCTVLKKHERERLLELDTLIRNQADEVILSGRAKVKVLTSAEPEKPSVAAHPKVAIVTGAAGGIGQAICLHLAKAGFSVVVNYRSRRDKADALVARLQEEGVGAVAVQADISTAEGAAAVVQAAVRSFSGVGVLVNNAAPAIGPKAFAAMQWGDIQKHLDVQVRGAFEMSQACLPRMTEQKWGRIINITSQVVDGAPSVTWTAYALAKAALASMSRYLAAELGPSNITVNCVAPGMTETPLIGGISEKAQMMVARQTPLRRLSQPDDIGGAVAYLASEEARFITGHTLAVNGGASMS